MEDITEIDCLPVDILSHCFGFIQSFKELALVSGVCRKWREGVKRSLARKERLSFSGWKMDDESTARMVQSAINLKELDISRSCWGSQITDDGLYKISLAKCCSNLTSISLWGMVAITDRGVVQLYAVTPERCFQYNLGPFPTILVLRAVSLCHLNIGGTFITDESLFAIAASCPHLKAIVLWGCRHVTESGLIAIVNNCHELESINIWGVCVSANCYLSLLSISPTLQIKAGRLRLNTATLPPVPAA